MNPFSYSPGSQFASAPGRQHWTEAAAALRAQGEGYVLVTVLTVKGSAPRDAGTKMLVCADRIVNTIGGGQLEYDAIQTARNLLLQGRDQQHLEDYPLGPKLGQCCGGRVHLLYECFAPSAVEIALFGAGHVGQALVSILSQLPVRLRWIDSRAEAFPPLHSSTMPSTVQTIVSDDPETEIAQLNPGAYVIVMTHNHPLDYAIAEAALKRNDTAYVGVIGSNTKAARFRMRLQYWGFPAEVIEHMRCPLGLSSVPGKQPMEVAVSVAAEVIGLYQQRAALGIQPDLNAMPIVEMPIAEMPGMETPGDEQATAQHGSTEEP
ncbi:MAG: xanthine dehydrogenase accessory protein XdhC [Pseudomonadota bacterium]|nr:xanthine dehydrogenase accessory protein XdhC [Pseudomonadota bacterium]